MNNKNTLLIRTTLANNVEYLLEKISSYKEELKNETMDLFFDDETVEDTIVLKKPEHINQLTVLLKEKEFLGLYVTANPVDQYSELLEYVRDQSENKSIYLVLIDKVKKIFTRNKDMMFGLEISKEGEKVEGIIFPKNALKLSPLIEEKQIYWVIGKISTPKKRKVEPQVVAEGDFESEEGNQVAEFVELPKLIIEDLIGYSSGVLPLLQSEENKLSKQRIAILNKIDYESILVDPTNISKYVGKINGTENVGIQNVRIDLTTTLDKNKAIAIKKILHEAGEDYNVLVYVQVITGEFKKAKTEYKISKESFINIQELLK
jgi:DNA polymerase III alpha subunit